MHFELETEVLVIVMSNSAGTAERVLAMASLSVCLSVGCDPVPIQAQMR